MDNVTLGQVKELRRLTQCGLYECKQALLNSDSFEDAITYLRKRGQILIQKYDY